MCWRFCARVRVGSSTTGRLSCSRRSSWASCSLRHLAAEPELPGAQHLLALDLRRQALGEDEIAQQRLLRPEDGWRRGKAGGEERIQQDEQRQQEQDGRNRQGFAIPPCKMGKWPCGTIA